VSIEGIGAKVAALEADNERIERQEQRIRKRGARAFGSVSGISYDVSD
jgi:hypothetical protein